MAEEFDESEIIFQEDPEEIEESKNEVSKAEHNNINKAKIRKLKTNHNHIKINSNNVSPTVPVNIPEINIQRKTFHRYSDSEDDYSEEIVPPHMIVRRRLAGKMTSFSVCTGHGRTLKGRDLSEVRNSILRMTGFLET